MPRFLFWNLNRRDLTRYVRYLAHEHDIDVLILAESGSTSTQILLALNDETSDYQFAPGRCGHLLFFTRFDTSLLTLSLESHRVSIRSLALPGHQTVLIAAAHLPSKINFSDDSQIFESVLLARMIDDAERDAGHQRTILLGDLNMNPFEPGMVAAHGGLNAVMSRAIAVRSTRTVQKQKYKYFYNPMWRHFGDHPDPGGTFYFESGEPVCYFWNMFDQVLLRPDLLHHFVPENVRILTTIRERSLLTGNGIPDKELASDHLPILLDLDFLQESEPDKPRANHHGDTEITESL